MQNRWRHLLKSKKHTESNIGYATNDSNYHQILSMRLLTFTYNSSGRVYYWECWFIPVIDTTLIPTPNVLDQ